MENYLGSVDEEKIEKIIDIKLGYLKGEMTISEAKRRLSEAVDKVTAQEFAICEQRLHSHGITDDELTDRMEEILEIFDGVLVSGKEEFPKGHPLRTYMDEVDAVREVLGEIRERLDEKFVKNEWLEIYEKLRQINIHFARKQNQLYPALEEKGFDKPSKIMWSLENEIRDAIKKATVYLENDEDEAFLNMQDEIVKLVEDMFEKEEDILYPTAAKMISDEEFIKMRSGDDEIGYCLIDEPPLYGEKVHGKEAEKERGAGFGEELSPEAELLKDFSNLLKKYGFEDSDGSKQESGLLDVSQGKLTLEQINLIFKHLSIDLTFVDEEEIVKFYSDTKHRVFPRSPGVIGREVENCHPRESVETVKEIIRAFKNGEQNEAEFWLEMDGKFIYIIYTAVRDENGEFKGVLELMQDATRIRSLEGSQRLLSWKSNS